MRYFDLIITRHAQEQITTRGIKLADVWETFQHPITTSKGKYSGSQFEREFDNYKIFVIAIQNKKNEWIVKTAWRDPELPGTADAKRKAVWKQYNKAGTLGKIWIQIKLQMGF